MPIDLDRLKAALEGRYTIERLKALGYLGN